MPGEEASEASEKPTLYFSKMALTALRGGASHEQRWGRMLDANAQEPLWASMRRIGAKYSPFPVEGLEDIS